MTNELALLTPLVTSSETKPC